MRVLIVPDKFKGTLTASQAAAAIERGWHRARPGDTLDLLPMSDGGDGFGQILGQLLKARRVRTDTVDARAESGFDIFAELARLRTRIRRADLVVTGEGALDDQSLMGKGVGRIADACREAGIPCIALAGVQTLQPHSNALLQGSWGLCPDFVSCEESLSRPTLHLARLAAHVAASTLWT